MITQRCSVLLVNEDGEPEFYSPDAELNPNHSADGEVLSYDITVTP